MKLKNKKVDIVVDLQYGSTGKGLICGYLARTGAYDTVIAANMPNAGHTFIEDRRKWVHKALPSGIFVSDNIMIGPGSVFDPARLAQEIKESEDILFGKRVMIHEAAGILMPHHKEQEQKTLSRISSTMQGSAACLADKIARKERTIAKDCIDILSAHGLAHLVVSQAEWLRTILKAKRILVEGSQGYSLGLSAGFYPYCTSRECTVARVLADCGVPPGFLSSVIGSARCHPIRVGNTADGHSGGHYPDQIETSWEKLGVTPETTTVTGRIRRVFTFSAIQITEAIIANAVDKVFLNFANYDMEYANEIISLIDDVCRATGLGQGVQYIGMGPARNDVVVPKTFNTMLTRKRESVVD